MNTLKRTLLALVACQAMVISATPSMTRHVQGDHITLGTRKRLSPRMMFFAEALPKYGMFQNFLHYWIDRPLFWDRSTRHPDNAFAYLTYPSFKIDMAQVRKYNLDGLGIFGSFHNGTKTLKQFEDYLERLQDRHLTFLPQISYGEYHARANNPTDNILTMIRTCETLKHVPRINGKLLLGTYNYRLISSSRHAEIQRLLRQKLNHDNFIIMGDLNFQILSKLQRAFGKNGKLTDSELKTLEKLLTEVLDVAGGIQLIITEKRRTVDGDYTSRYTMDFFVQCTAPILTRLLTLPNYRDKVLGFYVHQGYINHLSGVNHGEYGTETLRSTMREVLRHNPDYLLFFEWNEANENTCFQPTVYSGQTTGRLIKYYNCLANNLPITPYDQDDTSIPNISLSYCSTFKLGERLRFEVLNIPDGPPRQTHTVQLQLQTSAGEPVFSFPKENFDSQKLTAITYQLPSEEFQAGATLRPTLLVNGKTYRDFQTIRLDSTINWNYKSVRQNLRDLLPLKTCNFQIQKESDGVYNYDVTMDSPEPLASVELLEREDELTAAGIETEYDRKQNLIIRLAFTAPPKKSLRTQGTLRVRNVSQSSIRSCWLANVDPGQWVPCKDVQHSFTNKMFFWVQETVYHLQIPYKESAQAIVDFTFSHPDMHPVSIPVGKLVRHGVYSVIPNDKTSLRLEASIVNNLPDLPLHLNKKQLHWRGQVTTENRYPVFSLRAISKSGKIFRSNVICPEAMPSAPCVHLHLFSETQRKPIVKQVPIALIPTINYVFEPTSGAMLRSDSGRYFDGHLGGGFHYSEAFSSPILKVAPGIRAPQWIREDNRWILRFDGINDYVNFIRETFPQGPFTLSMSIRPDYTQSTMVLFRHFNYILGSLSLFIRDGKLYATWGGKDAVCHQLPLNLPIQNKTWNELTIRYDYSHLTFIVNGKQERIPFSQRALAFRSCIFGGHDKVEFSPNEPLDYFKGDLRRLELAHFAKDPAAFLPTKANDD